MVKAQNATYGTLLNFWIFKTWKTQFSGRKSIRSYTSKIRFVKSLSFLKAVLKAVKAGK